jgi:methionyl-tRNA formyltransferase
MALEGSADAAPLSLGDAGCALFAYHEMGWACMSELITMGVPITALYTHRDSRGEEIWWRSCADLARANMIPVHTPERIDSGTMERLAARPPAVIYSFYYRELIPTEVLDLAPLGAFNLHGSLLPKYRGRAPVNWMLVNGEREGGVTLHRMVARADAGDVVAQRAVEITDDDTALTLHRKIVPLGAALIREYHPRIVGRNAPRRPQDVAAGSYFGRRRPADGRIDWNWPARRIFNLARAVTHPYPGAFCDAAGRKLYIWRARIASESGVRAVPGTILRTCDEGAVEVAAGEGAVLIMRAQFEGDIERTAAELVAHDGIAQLK